jgi:signal transduction histidine kinase
MAVFNLKISNKNYFYLISGFSLIILLVSILLALFTITGNYKSLSYLDKGYGINERIDKIYSLLKDEENQQRGYMITGQTVFLNTLDYATKNIEAEYASLYEILKDESEQLNNLLSLKAEIDLKLKLLEQSKNYTRSRSMKQDSLKKIMAQGDFIMTKIRSTTSKMKHTEYKRFSTLRERTFRKSELSIFIVAITSGISILLLISILIALKREYQAKAEVEQKLIASEKRLQQQVHMLNISNKELEQFAYVASHDLEEPLRKISSFSEKIQMKLVDCPDEEVVDLLKRVNKSVARMKVFINDLLNYSRITRLLDVNEQVDLDALFKTIIEDLGVTIAAKKAVINVEPLPEVRGNNTQLKQLFQNLLTNALKFNDKYIPQVLVTGSYYTVEKLRATGWIKDFSLKHKNYYCIFVTDNGIGFELEYLRQIFVIFQRLHGRSEYDGTGIGLAICKKIVENHEGFITAESEVGKGTTFIVGLPLNKHL